MRDIVKLKNKIILDNPDILKLEFGCEVKILTDDSDFYGIAPKEWQRVKVIKVSPKKAVINVMWQFPNSEVDYESRIQAKELKILGRPIRLADIIYSLSKFSLRFDTTGFSSASLYLAHLTLQVLSNYNLKNDDIELQSQELIDYLTNLLCN